MMTQVEDPGRIIHMLLKLESGITDGFWVWTVGAMDEYLSPRLKKVLGYEDHELPNIAESWQRLIHPADKDRALDAVKPLLDGSGEYNLLVRYKHKAGHWLWIVCRGELFTDANGKPFIVGTHTDVTDVVNKFSVRSVIEKLGAAVERTA